MLTILRVAALAWGDAVIEGAFFIMQTYLTQVWKLNFTTAAAFLNIWGGIYRVLPLFFLFLADTLLGNFMMLVISGISSTMGLILITLAAMPLVVNSISCQEKDGACVGHTEKALYLAGMALVALGRASRFASTEPFIKEQTDHGSKPRGFWILISALVFFVTPLAGIFAFPYVRKWYVLFGASAICTASATVFFLSGYGTYRRAGANAQGSPITDIFRVFVAAGVKRSQPFPKEEEGKLYVVAEEQFHELSPSPMLGFLHKAAIIVDDDTSSTPGGEVKKNKRSWKLCSVSEVESVKTLIRLIPLRSCFIMCGVVSSIGNTYLIEQMSQMKSNIGSWNAPPQVVLLLLTIFKYYLSAVSSGSKIIYRINGALIGGIGAMEFSVACCAAAACVERRRLHLVSRHDSAAVEAPMSAFWVMFPFTLLVAVDIYYEFALSRFHDMDPKAMERYGECMSEGVMGLGFMGGALSVYVAGKTSEMGGGKGWFQEALDRSRLDRYYWALTAVSALVFVVFIALASPALRNFAAWDEIANVDGEALTDFRQETALGVFGIKKSSALGLLMCYFPQTESFLESVMTFLREVTVNNNS